MQRLAPLLLFFILPYALVAQLSRGGTPKGFTYANDQDNIPRVSMASFDVDAMLTEDEMLNGKGQGPYRFGKNFDVAYDRFNSGRTQTIPGLGEIWQLRIHSADAFSINLQFSYFRIPEGSELFIYNLSRSMVIGAFTSVNNQEDFLFATDLVQGDEIILEYFEPATVPFPGAFTLSTITHAYRNLFSEEFTRGFGDSGNCQFNTACSLSAGWEDQIRSVVMLVSGGNGFCTGALVNNTAQDGKPYVLTANHCGSSGFGSWVFRFNWQSPTCPNPSSSPSSQSLTGAVQRAANAGSDVSLVEITGGLAGGVIPQSYNAYLSGWNNINATVDSAFCIHHPNGDIKKFSVAKNSTQSGTYSGAQCWRVGTWTSGCTEPGSSGSPLYDPNRRIIGQLYGGPSYCGAPANQMNDFFGKFSTSWNGNSASTRLRDWLDPLNISTTTLDGYDPFAVVYALDAAVFSISSPANGINTCNTTINPVINIKNNGTLTVTSAVISWQLDGGAVQTQNWSGNLATGAFTSINLPTQTGLATGAHNLVVTISLPNGNADQNPQNDSRTSAFTIINPTPTAGIPTFNGAEFSSFPGLNYSLLNPDADVTWVKETTVSGFGTSNACFKIDNFSNNTAGRSDYIYTPYLNLVSASAPLQIAFNLAHAQYNPVTRDSLIISYTSNCGETWTRLYAKGGSGLSTTGQIQSTNFIPTPTQWRTELIDISNLVGMDDVRFSFQNRSAFGNNVYIDDINIKTNALSLNRIEVESDNFKVMPNPASDFAELILPGTFETGNLEIYDASGRVLQVMQPEEKSIRLNLQGFNNGLYTIRYTNGENRYTKRFLVLKERP